MLAATGNVGASAKEAGYTRSRVYQWRKDDTDFADAWDDAMSSYVEMLETEADRRGMHGTEKPVFYLGEVAGHIRQYSDTLLIFRLKALRPDVYRERAILPPAPPSDPVKDQAATPGLSDDAADTIRRKILGIPGEDGT